MLCIWINNHNHDVAEIHYYTTIEFNMFPGEVPQMSFTRQLLNIASHSLSPSTANWEKYGVHNEIEIL